MSKKRKKKTQKFVVYLMIFAILASTLFAGMAMFF
ncbi:MAG TPA: stressosome-associated protein Prli42 [Bacillus sp. (in: firmicutes)]|nr:stressosome-associated protein Prli42 [Bacillus sp. (in: firmicutes)]